MKISQDVRDYALAQGVAAQEALELGLAEKASEFQEAGGELYAPSK